MRSVLAVCTSVMCSMLFSGSNAEFSWKHCDDSSAGTALKFQHLSLSPDPISTDAFVYADFEATITRNLTRPLTLSLSIKKIVRLFWLFETDIPVPCLPWAGDYGVGSCTYDACEMSDHFERLYGCPAEFTDNGIPCTCPIPPGEYSTSIHPHLRIYLDASSVPLVPTRFLSGNYRTTVRLADGLGNVGCVEYTNSIQNN